MKRKFIIPLALILALSMTACGTETATEGSQDAATVETAVEEDKDAETGVLEDVTAEVEYDAASSVEGAPTGETDISSESGEAEETVEEKADADKETDADKKADAKEEGTSKAEKTSEVGETSETAETTTTEKTPAENASTEDDATAYTYTDLSATKYAKSTVNVRDLPDKSGTKIGGLSTNDEVAVTGQCNETGWYRIDYNGTVAYVSDSYLIDEKTTASASTTSSGSGKSSSKSGAWMANYEKYVWYDMGDYVFILTNSLEEACALDTYENNSHYTELLQSRYPDRHVITFGTGPAGSLVYSALHTDPTTGFPIWSEIYYLWHDDDGYIW